MASAASVRNRTAVGQLALLPDGTDASWRWWVLRRSAAMKGSERGFAQGCSQRQPVESLRAS
jgi:hypothetical protein